MGDIVISHYGLESGLIYKQGRALRHTAVKSNHAAVSGFVSRSKHRALGKNYSRVKSSR